MTRLSAARLIVAFVLLATAAARAQDLTVYDDALQNGFQDWSYNTVPPNVLPNFADPTIVHTGLLAISFDQSSYSSAISFAHPGGSYTVAQYSSLHFWIHGGATGNQKLQVVLQLTGTGIVAQGALDTYITGGAIAAGTWREVTVSFASAPLSYSGSFDRIDLEGNVASPQGILYVDDVTLVAAVTPPTNLMQIERDVTVASMVSDRFTWRDSSNQPRVAVLAHNDGAAGPGGVRGGALREFRYQLPDASTRVATVTTYGNGGYGGFGYVVSHASNYAGCVGDDSPLGDFFPGLFQRVFEGRHHVVFRFTQNYPRNCSTSNVMARTIPVTIDWVFSTGRDNPVWAVTWDVDLASPAAPVNTFWDDSRGPYGELNIDGDGWTDIDGVAWGDRYKFTSTSAPVTLGSQWTYNVANTVPYVKLWLAAPMVMPGHTKDATMGLVQTQTMDQQDAAGGRLPGYHDITQCWGKTPATPCSWTGDPNVMPWQDDWAYQANADSIGASASNNARLTWRTQYGFIGQSTYVVHDGVIPDPPGHPGFPKKSYSVYVVLGTHSTGPVETQVTQVETVQSLDLAAAIGSVVTSGPAGAARADNVTYAPPGYNHVYGALAFAASGNSLDANIAVGVGTLKKPLLILGSYTGAYPTVKLGGVTLVQDVDYFPSLRASASELWITLNRDLSGATNHLEILPACSAPAPTIGASGPTTFCAGGSVTLTASIAPGAGISYLWSPGGETTPAIVVTASGSYAVTVTVSGCAGTSPSTAVTVNPIPATPAISAPASVAPLATGLLASVTSHAGSTYLWGITNGSITSGQGSSQITFTAGSVGTLTLTVVETNAGCPSAQASAPVTVAPSGTGLRLHTLAPCRVIDTRHTTGPDAGAPALGVGETRVVTVAGKCTVPSTAVSLSANLTITNPTATGSLTLYPANASSRPPTTTVNFVPGRTRANNAILLLAADGTGLNVYNGSAGTVDFILDVNGWFE